MIARIVIWLAVVALGAALLFGIVAGYEWWRDGKVEEGRIAGRAEIQQLWDEDRSRAQAQAIEGARLAAAETLRRLTKQQENQVEQDRLLAAARRDAAAARTAADGLRLRAATYLDAAGCGSLAGDPAAECIRTAVAALGDALGRSGEIARRAAADADEARTRGLKCTADYEALTLRPADAPVPPASSQP